MPLVIHPRLAAIDIVRVTVADDDGARRVGMGGRTRARLEPARAAE